VTVETTQSVEEKKRFVRDKFASINKDYDFLNYILSMKVDLYWRLVTTRGLKEFPEGAIFGFCAGTLPFSVALDRQGLARNVLAKEFW